MDDKYRLLIKMKSGKMLEIKTDSKTIEMLQQAYDKKEEFSDDYMLKIENEKVRIKAVDYFAWSADIFAWSKSIFMYDVWKHWFRKRGNKNDESNNDEKNSNCTRDDWSN